MYSAAGVQTSLWMGCPIRILRAPRSHAAPPERFAGLRVLRRPSAPRHPPRTLSRLFNCSLTYDTTHVKNVSRVASLANNTSKLLCSLCCSRLFSALGKIEVIILYHISAMQL